MSGLSQPVDDRIIKKIEELVAEGVKDTYEMRRHLRVFLKNDLFCEGQELPPSTKHRFHPKLSDIRNHMYRATVRHRLSKIDQENVASRVEEWKTGNSGDFFFFRPYQHLPSDDTAMVDGPQDSGDEDAEEEIIINQQSQGHSLLFVHQTAWQRRLLVKYGNSLCLLDATYKTTRYALPLFFLVVKTNVDYQVVGSFVTQQETTIAIKEALKLLKQWTPDWSPPFFMTDNCEQEIRAIEDTFPGMMRLTSMVVQNVNTQT